MQLVNIRFSSDTIEVIDNLVSINSISQNLGIDPNFQRKKVQADETFQSQFKEIEINGIIQKVLCIPYDKVNGWLFSISVNRVKPEVKQKLIEYKNECFDVLHKHFNKDQHEHDYRVINAYKMNLANNRKRIETLEAQLSNAKGVDERIDDLLLNMERILKKYNFSDTNIMQMYIAQNRNLSQIAKEYKKVAEHGDMRPLLKEMDKLRKQRQESDERYYELREKVARSTNALQEVAQLADVLK